jgi:hypothetical protein
MGDEDMKITPLDYVSKAKYWMPVEPGVYIIAW